MIVKDITSFLETIAPPVYQESYDNAGLIVGDPSATVTGIITCLDATETIVEEAIAKNCNLVVAHHPIVFRGLKRLNGRTYVERVVMKAIKHDIAIYAIHTNLDNVYHQGVNSAIARRLGLQDTSVLAPKAVLKKLTTWVGPAYSEQVRLGLAAAGAGRLLSSDHNSFALLGVGYSPEGTAPEVKLEVLFQQGIETQVLQALHTHHPAPRPAYEVVSVENKDAGVGAGLVGELPKALPEKKFLQLLRDNMKTGCIRHTRTRGKEIRRVALCGGAGGFLLGDALAARADAFVTADYKYHEFFDADDRILIADIGHFESEQFTIELLAELLMNNFPNFAIYSTEHSTNPVFYFT